jgi:hypothetical protein
MKWEGRGLESKKIFFVWLKLKIEAKIIFYPFTQICIISHKGTIFSQNKNSVSECIFIVRGLCGRDRLVAGFTTTYTINTYHH